MNQIKTNFVYKGRFYLGILRKFLGMFIYYYLWMAIYANSALDSLGGFTRDEMVIYVFMSYVVSDFVMVGISGNIGRDVVDGSIAVNLIKPIDYRLRMIFQAFGIMVYRLIVPSLFIWIGLEIFKISKFGIDVNSVVNFTAFLISTFFSFLIYVLFDYCFGLLAFVTTYIFGMAVIKNAVLNFLTGKLIPIAFFPYVFQRIFEFMPFTAMIYVPVMIYLGKFSGIEIIYELIKQLVWVVILWLTGSMLWKKAEKRLVVLGG